MRKGTKITSFFKSEYKRACIFGQIVDHKFILAANNNVNIVQPEPGILTRSKSGSSQSTQQISSVSQRKQLSSDSEQLEVCREVSCTSQADDSQPNLGVLTRSKSSSSRESRSKSETNGSTTQQGKGQQSTQKSHRPCYFKDEWLEDEWLGV